MTFEQCDRPPEGWECSRPKGHNGPCAASPKPSEASWSQFKTPGRVAPRECINCARKQLSKVYTTDDPKRAMKEVLGAVDWLRRALEQMVEQ